MPLSAQILTGPIHSVKCPHCSQGNDFREIEEELAINSDASGSSSQKVECDHCHRNMEVVQIAKVTMVSVRQA